MDQKTPAAMKPRSRRRQGARVAQAFFMGIVLGQAFAWATNYIGLPILSGILAAAALAILLYVMGVDVGLELKEKDQ